MFTLVPMIRASSNVVIPAASAFEIIARTQLSSNTQRRLSLMLTHGNYLVLTCKGQLGGDSPMFADTGAQFAVS